MDDSVIFIVVGPIKTGTTWLHSLLDSSLDDKEIRFPVIFGRDYVYHKFVKNKRIIIWPYLLHEPKCLWSLLDKLHEVNRPFRIYACWRSPESWRQSMYRFRKRATNAQGAKSFVVKREKIVRETLKKLKLHSNVTCLRLINPRPRDLFHLNQITGLSYEELLKKSSQPVYSTQGSAKINSVWLSAFYFRIKPFLPSFLRKLNRSSFGLFHIFFK